MKKVIIWLLLFTILVGGVYSANVGYKGYKLYQKTMSDIDIQTTIDSYRTRDGYVNLEDIPRDFLDAIVAVEDHRFYDHSGFDIISFGRAVIQNVSENEYAAGGSTITQQLAKNLFFSFEKKMERKVAELIVAKQIEEIIDKDIILELYVNIIYYGDGHENLRDACMGYFNKNPEELSTEESILLAGLPQAPSVYALSTHYDKAIKRSLDVIDALVEHGYLTKQQGIQQKINMENLKIQVN